MKPPFLPGLPVSPMCAAAALSFLVTCLPAPAVPFTVGEIKGNFDSTLSFGALHRLQDPSPDYYGITNAFAGELGRQTSVNADDGNLNYAKGWASAVFKGTHDLELKYRDYGVLVRGYWFSDLKSDHTLRTPLSDQARERVVRGADWLDLYARAKFTVGSGMPLDLRIGRQVLSLGESTFIPNGINVINSADLSKLRVPGSELREALLPVNMIKASLGLAPNVTIEPFWLLEFRRNELEPAGTYFSTNDFATRGGKNVLLGFGSLPDNGTLGVIPRENERDAGNLNQYGVALRFLAPSLNKIEFGLYYARYNSRSPVLNARTPTGPVSAALVQTTALTLGQQNLSPALLGAGLPAGFLANALQILVGTALTAPAGTTPALPLIPIGAGPSGTINFPLAPFYPAAVQIANGARQIGLLTAARTGRYFTEYPEGIDQLGASFNTSLGKSGISWQGEVSLKNHQPLQVDDVELLFATLSSLSPIFGQPNNQLGSYLGRYGLEVSGSRRHRVWTAQSTLTKVFGPILGSQQFTVLGEVGGVWANLPPQDTLRYEAPGTFSGGSAVA
ncbi:MAG: hypothetical protein RIQ93_3255, partial [Verrucomicrobiota bacterium]